MIEYARRYSVALVSGKEGIRTPTALNIWLPKTVKQLLNLPTSYGMTVALSRISSLVALWFYPEVSCLRIA